MSADERRELEKRYLYWLWRADFLGAVSIRRLYGMIKSFAAIYNIEEIGLRRLGVLSDGQLARFAGWKRRFPACEREYGELDARGIRFVSFLDEDYPARLADFPDAPVGLTVLGRLPEEHTPTAAVVGARACSEYGAQLAEAFARALAAENVQIISGLAQGIDGAAHRGALQASGATFGIMGCGVNVCYPPSHYALYEEMIRTGGVISEFPLGTNPVSRNFPMRNRIISGLADVILVVEAREKSGSLITAGLGLEQGKDIFAVPGRVTDCLSRGCNALIAQGAYVAKSPEDILEYLGIKCHKKIKVFKKNLKSLAKKEKMVYSCLDFKPQHLDQIVARSGLGISECMGILLELELSGYAFRAAGHYYGKKV